MELTGALSSRLMTCLGQIMEMVIDISNNQIIDTAESMVDQFRDHFQKMSGGESGAKWVSRFCKVYVTHRGFIVFPDVQRDHNVDTMQL